jgi:hypothetical protein
MELIKNCTLCNSPLDQWNKTKGHKTYCRACFSQYHKERAIDPGIRLKNVARVKAKDALKKGLIMRWPCAICNDPDAEMHHSDYNKPLDVHWLCKVHHEELHTLEYRALKTA